MSSYEDTELRDLLMGALEQNGTLGQIRAQLRASVFLALEDQEHIKHKTPLRNAKAHSFIENSKGNLCAVVVREFLQTLNLAATLSIYDHEIGLTIDCPSRDDVRQTLGLSSSNDADTSYNQEDPILLVLIDHWMTRKPSLKKDLSKDSEKSEHRSLGSDKTSGREVRNSVDQSRPSAAAKLESLGLSDVVKSPVSVGEDDDDDDFFDLPTPKAHTGQRSEDKFSLSDAQREKDTSDRSDASSPIPTRNGSSFLFDTREPSKLGSGSIFGSSEFAKPVDLVHRDIPAELERDASKPAASKPSTGVSTGLSGGSLLGSLPDLGGKGSDLPPLGSLTKPKGNIGGDFSSIIEGVGDPDDDSSSDNFSASGFLKKSGSKDEKASDRSDSLPSAGDLPLGKSLTSIPKNVPSPSMSFTASSTAVMSKAAESSKQPADIGKVLDRIGSIDMDDSISEEIAEELEVDDLLKSDKSDDNMSF